MFLVLGLRPGQLFALHRDDVEGNRIRVDQSASWKQDMVDPKTKASNGFVWMPDKLAADLVDWMDGMKDRRPETLLFATNRGTPMDRHNYLGRNIKKIAAAALKARQERCTAIGEVLTDGYLTGVNHQAFRRTCATWAQEGGTLKDVQAMLRHSSPAMTAGIYIQPIPESVKRAVESLDEKLR